MLRKICGSRKVLPTTYEVSREVSSIRQLPDASGGFGDVYEGSLSAKVCIKRLRISSTGDQEKVKEVSHSRNLLLNNHVLTSFEGFLQRGRGVETSKPPKYRTLQGCYVQSSSAYFGMDAQRRAARLCKGESGYEPHQPCRSIFVNPNARSHPSPQLLGIAEGLTYLHSCGVIHGDLKGVRVIGDFRIHRLTEVITAKHHGR